MKKHKNSDTVFNVVNYVILGLVVLVIAYPLYYILIASFSDPYQVYAGKTFLHPVNFSLEGYKRIFMDDAIVRGYLNSIVYTVVGTFVSVVLVVITGYAVSKNTLPGRQLIMIFFVFTMYFTGGLIPTYMVVNNMGLINSMWALILPGQVAVFNVIITRTFFQTSIPPSLTEAAAIDGCSNLRTFVSIILPLSKPVISVMVIFSMVAFWNDWFAALIYLPEQAKAPLQLVLRKVLIQSQAARDMMSGMGSYADANKITEMIKFSSIIVASVPMLIVYPFVQKYFSQGIMIGAVKG